MKTKLLLGMSLFICTLCSCDPENKDIIKPEQPPIEQPEQPNKPEEPEEPQKPEEPAPINGIIKINNEYMAVGTSEWKVITFGNGKYVVSGNNYVTSSTDGENWTSPKAISGLSDGYVPYGAAYGNGIYVVGGSAGVGFPGNYSTSTDGTSWATATKLMNLSSIYSVEFLNNQFIILGTEGVNSYSLISPDGKNWLKRLIDNGTLMTIMYGNGKYIAVSTSGVVYTSTTNGGSWTRNTKELPQSDWNYGVFGNGKFVTISTKVGSKHIATSADGENWTNKIVGTSRFKCITFGDGKFVATNFYKDVFTSTDGENWTQLNDLPFEANDIIFVQ